MVAYTKVDWLTLIMTNAIWSEISYFKSQRKAIIVSERLEVSWAFIT